MAPPVACFLPWLPPVAGGWAASLPGRPAGVNSEEPLDRVRPPLAVASTPSRNAGGKPAGRRAGRRWSSGLPDAALLVGAAAVLPAWSRRAGRRTRTGRAGSAAAAGAPQSLGKFVKKRSKYPDEKPEPGDLVRIHYVGRLEDGRVFDSSRARNTPFEFVLGESQVIDGWDLLVGTMALGEQAELVIPPEYAYGEEGVPTVVPPGATLTFDVELLDIGRPVDDDAGGEEGEGVVDAEVVPAEAAPAPAPAAAAAAPASEGATGVFWENEPEREGGAGAGYSWEASGTGAEVLVSVPLGGEVRVREIRVDVKTHGLGCEIAGERVFDGELFAAVDCDDSHWDLERRGDALELVISLAKLDRHEKWGSLFKGGDAPEPQEPPALEAEVVDVDAALRMANEQSRRRAGGL